jgi:hypothetical protein
MRKIVLISLALVLALGTLGVAYAMWDKTLYVEGNVATGEVNAIITSIASDDPVGTIDPYYGVLVDMPADPVYPRKDVADTTAWIDAEDNQIAHVLIEDGYPCYWVAVHFTVYNNGSIPIIYTGFDTTNVPAEIFCDPGDSVGEQIDPSDHLDYTIYFHVEQTPNDTPGAWGGENETYNFTLSAHFVQYNEYP